MSRGHDAGRLGRPIHAAAYLALMTLTMTSASCDSDSEGRRLELSYVADGPYTVGNRTVVWTDNARAFFAETVLGDPSGEAFLQALPFGDGVTVDVRR